MPSSPTTKSGLHHGTGGLGAGRRGVAVPPPLDPIRHVAEGGSRDRAALADVVADAVRQALVLREELLVVARAPTPRQAVVGELRGGQDVEALVVELDQAPILAVQPSLAPLRAGSRRSGCGAPGRGCGRRAPRAGRTAGSPADRPRRRTDCGLAGSERGGSRRWRRTRNRRAWSAEMRRSGSGAGIGRDASSGPSTATPYNARHGHGASAVRIRRRPGRRPMPDAAARALRAQLLATEHWSLLATRSLSWNESFARAGMFLTLLSGATVALALVAQATSFGEGFVVFALLILPVVLFVGSGDVRAAARDQQRGLRLGHGHESAAGGVPRARPELAPATSSPARPKTRSASSGHSARNPGDPRQLSTPAASTASSRHQPRSRSSTRRSPPCSPQSSPFSCPMAMAPAAVIGVVTFFVVGAALFLFGYRSQDMAQARRQPTSDHPGNRRDPHDRSARPT